MAEKTPEGSSETPRLLRGEDAFAGWLRRFSARPARAALFFDIDGTISPIARTPDEAVVPETTRELLRRLVRACGLVAFVTGRALEDGRRLVGLEHAAYVGNHGLDVLRADGRLVSDPRAERFVPVLQAIIARARAAGLDRQGIVLEDKRTVLAVHYRPAADRQAAQAAIDEVIVAAARETGLRVSTGRLAIEVRPPIDVSKGESVRTLLADADFGTAAFFGDDLTDCDGFRALQEWELQGSGRRALTVAAISDETPDEVRRSSAVWVSGTDGMCEVLRILAEAVPPGS